MCEILIQMGVDIDITDEIRKWNIHNLNVFMWLLISYTSAPIHTMIDSALVERYRDLKSAALTDVGLLYNMTSQDLVKEH